MHGCTPNKWLVCVKDVRGNVTIGRRHQHAPCRKRLNKGWAVADVGVAVTDAEGVVSLEVEYVLLDCTNDMLRQIKRCDDKLPKLRLCINPMYINRFLKYEPLKYDRLQDLIDIIGPGDFMSTSDDNSGY
ncbi:hypothetical protein WJX77_009604 [Trebouxia sp. C0004]